MEKNSRKIREAAEFAYRDVGADHACTELKEGRIPSHGELWE